MPLGQFTSVLIYGHLTANGLAIIGIIGHLISVEGVIQHGLLAMKKMEGAHTEENQAALVIYILTEYKLFKKIGYFTLDNLMLSTPHTPYTNYTYTSYLTLSTSHTSNILYLYPMDALQQQR